MNVLYAASLEQLIDTRIAPAFDRLTGYTLAGYPAGSTDLASEIKSGVRRGDVFISAAADVNRALEGAGNGDWVSWYAPFATTSLVIGYNPRSSFAGALRTQPWYRVIARPGFRLGFTDPRLDPKGALTVAALRAAAVRYHDPALLRIASDQSDLFPEQDLVGRLQAGQLDAGFFYTVEAAAAHIPTVPITPIHGYATYTITVLNRAPDARGAAAFVRFLLGPAGRAQLRAVGLAAVSRPVAIGAGVPASLRDLIAERG
ncbi:MAG TPA: substrate-binding domain-containing protein [Solirubrobacteraceae bacterium]|nr:substrate-binding domain-containing protein [Solirubrobacteraceae bacterium]